MNEQALLLQRMAKKFRPDWQGPALQWLLHSCTVGIDLGSMARACEILLDEMGWETTVRMAERLNDAGDGAPRPKAFIAQTFSDEIQQSRITGSPTIIFVLDTTPASLIKTYRQIKSLVDQGDPCRTRIGLLFVSPIDGGRERLFSSCQNFLALTPSDLGAIPGSLVRGPVSASSFEAGFSWGCPDAEVLSAWRPFVRRCLSQM